MQLLGPVRRLRILSTLFPYLVSEDEQAMRNADVMLQSVPVKWYRRMKIQSHKDKNKKNGYLMDAVNDINCTSFSGDDPGDNDNGGIPYDEKTVKSMMTSKTRKTMRTAKITCPPTILEESPNYSAYIAIDSTINVIDTKEGPSLEVVSNKYGFEDDDDGKEQCDESGFFTPSMTMRKVVPFKNMQVACAGDISDWETLDLIPTKNGIIIFEKPESELNTTVDTGDDERGSVEVFESYSTDEEDTCINNVYNHNCGDYDRMMRADCKTKLFVCQLILDSKISLTRDEALRHLNTLINWGDIVHNVDEGKKGTIFNVIKKEREDSSILHPPSTIEVAHSPKRMDP